MKKNTMELHHRCLRRPWVREIWVRIGVSDLGFLICCSDLLFLRVSSDLLVIPLCFCSGVLRVSVLVCEISLWNSSLQNSSSTQENELEKLEFHVDFFPHHTHQLTNRDLKTLFLS